MASFYQWQTVSAVAEYIAATIDGINTSEVSQDSVILLRQGKADESPFYLVHPLGGDVSCYMTLINRLNYAGEVWGIRAADIEDPSSGQDDLKGLARTYAHQILKRQHQAPVRLAGWSFGGVVAIEVARTLRSHGIKVENLVLIDSYNPETIVLLQQESHLSLEQKRRELIANFGAELGIDRAMVLSLFIEPDMTAEMMLLKLHELGRSQQAFSADISLQELQKRWSVMTEFDTLFEKHRPDLYPEPVLLLEAKNPNSNTSSDSWKNCLPRMTVEEIQGEHFSLLRKPYVDSLAVTLSKAFRESTNYGSNN